MVIKFQPHYYSSDGHIQRHPGAYQIYTEEKVMIGSADSVEDADEIILRFNREMKSFEGLNRR